MAPVYGASVWQGATPAPGTNCARLVAEARSPPGGHAAKTRWSIGRWHCTPSPRAPPPDDRAKAPWRGSAACARSLHAVALEHFLGAGSHLFPQVRLVVLDRLGPRCDGLLVAHPDRVGDLLEQFEVVRDEHAAAVELLHREGERVDHVHVERVGRLVEQQQVGVPQRHEAEDDARAEAGRHGRHRQRLVPAGDAEDAELAAPVGHVHLLEPGRGHEAVGVEVSHEVERVLLQVEHILRVLVVPADA
mmetsp:Transcript_73552/g.202030  ORF Transcript_73552/g.202030 Transcript_73552/m.202030 type:complete len:247 (-) Transcript_73552:600-1340(-)